MTSTGPGLERLLPFACVAAAAVLLASNFMTAFEFTPPGGEALADQSILDRHSFAPALFAVLAVLMVFVAVGMGSKPAAVAVAACGAVALLIFLLFDLPDAGNVGTLDDARQTFATAEAVPQPGFWLQLVGALGLTLSGAAMATLTPDQIRALGPGGGRKPRDRRREARAAAGEAPESRRTSAKSESG